MPYTLLLIEAGEGETGAVYVASGTDLAPLCALITATAADRTAQDWRERPAIAAEDAEYWTRPTAALRDLLHAHTPLQPGRYLLRPTVPPVRPLDPHYCGGP